MNNDYYLSGMAALIGDIDSKMSSNDRILSNENHLS